MLKMIDPDEALEIVLDRSSTRPGETVEANAGLGRVLAQSVVADRDFPPFARAMMDGYAVRVAEAGQSVRLAGEVAAGQAPTKRFSPGVCFAIMTGAACPPGTEAVVMIEDTERDGDKVRLPKGITEGQHIAPQGSECPTGREVLSGGFVLTPLALAILAATGTNRVEVIRRPRVAVITTGDELTAPGQTPDRHQIRDSNGPMLASQVARAGLPPALVQHASDTVESLMAALERTGLADIVLLTGGVSMGRYDLVPDALRAFGAEGIFHKVTQKPGKPLWFGTRGEQLLFGLPGNPLSTHFCFHRYVWASLDKMSGRNGRRPAISARLAAPLSIKSDRTLFLPGYAREQAEGLEVTVFPGRGSADLFAAPGANAYARLASGTHYLAVGDHVDLEWMGEVR